MWAMDGAESRNKRRLLRTGVERRVDADFERRDAVPSFEIQTFP